MDLRFKDEMGAMPDLRHRLRRLRWFRATFRAHSRSIAQLTGLRFEIDETALARVFFDWVEIVEAQKSYARLDRADFVVFAAGLALRELIRNGPARVVSRDHVSSLAETPALLEIVRFWPEGYLYTNYCVAAIAAIHEQEFGEAPKLDTCVNELRTWWSYRENAEEIPALAAAFLDRFLGTEPNWMMPDLVPSRKAMREAISRASHEAALPQQV